MTRGPATVLLALALAVALAATAVAQEPSPPQEQEIGRLFTQTAKRGTLEPAKGKPRFTLKLRGVAPQVVWFDDRPGRQTGQIPVGGFVRSWAGFGFEEVPPNAALTLLDAADHEDTVVVKLGEPRYKRKTRTVRYPALLLDEATGNLSHLEPRRDGRVPRRFGAASLFIDDATAQVVNGCVIQPHTDCQGANLSDADLRDADLTHGHLADAIFTEADLIAAHLRYATLTDAIFFGADLRSADVRGVLASHATFTNADLTDADLRGADLTDADFDGANLTGTRFCNTTMPNGSLNNSDC
jgi:hypothetical protein